MLIKKKKKKLRSGSMWEIIIKIRAEINEIESRKTIKKINKTKILGL